MFRISEVVSTRIYYACVEEKRLDRYLFTAPLSIRFRTLPRCKAVNNPGKQRCYRVLADEGLRSGCTPVGCFVLNFQNEPFYCLLFFYFPQFLQLV